MYSYLGWRPLIVSRTACGEKILRTISAHDLTRRASPAAGSHSWPVQTCQSPDKGSAELAARIVAAQNE